MNTAQGGNTDLLTLEGLSKHFRVGTGFMGTRRQVLRAVDNVDLKIKKGEVLGLVGESGCGKSTLGRCCLRLLNPTKGRIFFDGKDITSLKGGELRALRTHMQIVFQDPVTSLNPRMTVGAILAEPFLIHHQGGRSQVGEKVAGLLQEVGLRPEHARRYPHQFSGGQRQRIGIARALALRPSLVVADEPVSALDVSIQAQVMNLLLDLKERFGLTYLFVAHDLSVVRHLSDRIAVMYLGKIVEVAPRDGFAKPPMHPYTQALLASAPVADPAKRFIQPPLSGDVPSPINPPSGCRFHTRCPEKKDICTQKEPELEEIEPRHFCACHFR